MINAAQGATNLLTTICASVITAVLGPFPYAHVIIDFITSMKDNDENISIVISIIESVTHIHVALLSTDLMSVACTV